MPDPGTVRIFVVEDDPVYTKFMKYVLGLNPDWTVTCFSTAQEVLQRLHERPDVLTLDYSLPDMPGEKLLAQIRDLDPELPVIVVSAQDKIRTAVELLKAGAFDYISKDEEARERILNSIQNALNQSSMLREIGRLRNEITSRYDFEKDVIGLSTSMRNIFPLLEKAAKSNITVTITGETGTGKELVAKAIHYNSDRKGRPFVAVNIAAVPKELIESELFGHEKGSFTGAQARRIGRFEEAQGGTLLLDEIGEMDLNLQAKLLRVLQEKELTRVGGNEVIKLNVRIIVATHRNLEDDVQQGRFRNDLYYRLLGLRIHLPPLRERGKDTLAIAKHFLDQFTRENKMSRLRLSPEAQEKLLSYSFPGNVRELKSVVELAAVMAEGGEVRGQDITFAQLPANPSMPANEMTLVEYNYRLIRSYLTKYDNNVLEVGRRLGISKSSIYRYLKEMEAAGL
ncbi:MAG: sigma-54-dependent Fis family transcriptional regulator [Cyclobacteriaceae bacterium]|nr:sigma-54-dependent Fis family transcriptional regulator [Cyclobacteriaceae bacterium]